MNEPELAEDGLPPLREVIARLSLSARKSLGQNFLPDLNLTRRIARAAGPLDGHAVIEVGPGPGGLTRALLLEGAEKVFAIERDPRMIPALEVIAARWPGRLKIIEGDALSIDMAAIAERSGLPVRVAANLPYNIATPLLVKWLKCEPWPPWWQSLTLMFQREVADRITAMPGENPYGRLAVLAQVRCRPRRLFDISPRAFVPPPKVVSSLVRIDPLAEPRGHCDMATLEQVTAAAFGQRRKMLRTSLKSLGLPRTLLESLLAEAGLAPTARAEEIAVEAYCRLAALVAAARNGHPSRDVGTEGQTASCQGLTGGAYLSGMQTPGQEDSDKRKP